MNKGVKPLKIGIIGAGFSGTALAATLHRLNQSSVQSLKQIPIEIILFEKTGCFGMGPAYATPYPYHLLNVRAHDMSAFEDEPEHFIKWLTQNQNKYTLDKKIPLDKQFVSRFLYRHYLHDLLQTIQTNASNGTSLQLEPSEVIDALPYENQVSLILKDARRVIVDKIVLALGNHLPSTLPFFVAADIHCITNPWAYTALQHISMHDPVLIVGTGLSMIDAVLTLYHQQHQGPIYAVSRHGLLPLPHTDHAETFLLKQECLPRSLRLLTKYIRLEAQHHLQRGGDWRSIINALRAFAPTVWDRLNLTEKKQFLRHLLPYWNIHRHRVHDEIANLLTQLSKCNQLKVMSGCVLSVANGSAKIRWRYTNDITQISVKWLINCTGPAFSDHGKQPLINALLKRGLVSLDELKMGLWAVPCGALKTTTGAVSSMCYTLGPMKRGTSWGVNAVPEIRKQCLMLAKHLLNMSANHPIE